jgi:hypothetical protein
MYPGLKLAHSALGKKIIIVKNATAYTWDWYCHLVVDKASLAKTLSTTTVVILSALVPWTIQQLYLFVSIVPICFKYQYHICFNTIQGTKASSPPLL